MKKKWEMSVRKVNWRGLGGGEEKMTFESVFSADVYLLGLSDFFEEILDDGSVVVPCFTIPYFQTLFHTFNIERSFNRRETHLGVISI